MSAKISYRSVTRQSKESAGMTINFPVPKALCPCDPPSTFWKSSWKVRAGEAVVNEAKVQPFFPEETRKRRALACLIWPGIAYSHRKLGPRPGRQRSLKRWGRNPGSPATQAHCDFRPAPGLTSSETLRKVSDEIRRKGAEATQPLGSRDAARAPLTPPPPRWRPCCNRRGFST